MEETSAGSNLLQYTAWQKKVPLNQITKTIHAKK